MSENIKKEIFKKIKIASESKTLKINENTKLIGNQAVLDSNSLVLLCVELEGYAMKLNFEFDWTSEKAMSKLSSVFMNVETISTEFIKQYKNKK